MSNIGIVIAGVSGTILTIIFTSIALSGLWVASDQIVRNSGDPYLQSVYEPSKQMVDTAMTVDDGRETVKAWLALIGLIGGGGFGIWLISKIDFNF